MLDKLVTIKLTSSILLLLETFQDHPSLQFNEMLVNLFCLEQIIYRKVLFIFFSPSPLSKQVSLSWLYDVVTLDASERLVLFHTPCPFLEQVLELQSCTDSLELLGSSNWKTEFSSSVNLALNLYSAIFDLHDVGQDTSLNFSFFLYKVNTKYFQHNSYTSVTYSMWSVLAQNLLRSKPHKSQLLFLVTSLPRLRAKSVLYCC